MFSLKGKKAIVTGSGSGIGKATAILFAEMGATVYLIDLHEEAIGTTAKEISGRNGTAIAQRCNVVLQEEVKTVFGGIGAPDILVNSAGVSHVGNIESTSEADFDCLYNVNVKGVYNCMLAAVPAMKEAGRGVILNLASIANNVGLAERFAYSMSKRLCSPGHPLQLHFAGAGAHAFC